MLLARRVLTSQQKLRKDPLTQMKIVVVFHLEKEDGSFIDWLISQYSCSSNGFQSFLQPIFFSIGFKGILKNRDTIISNFTVLSKILPSIKALEIMLIFLKW